MRAARRLGTAARRSTTPTSQRRWRADAYSVIANAANTQYALDTLEGDLPKEEEAIDLPQIVLVEGINILGDAYAPLLDLRIYLDAEEQVVIDWFVTGEIFGHLGITLLETALGFVIGILSDGLVMMGVSSFWQTVIKGVVIIAAVILLGGNLSGIFNKAATSIPS